MRRFYRTRASQRRRARYNRARAVRRSSMTAIHRRRSNRSTRKAAASRTSTARRCSSRARCPASGSTIEIAQAQAELRHRARRRRSQRASASRVDAALPALRRVRRLHAAARAPSLQVAAKQRALEDALARIGRVRPETSAAADRGPGVGLPAIARGCRCATSPKKGGVLVGFHERKSSFVADMTRMPRAAAQAVGPAGAAARAGRDRCRSATGCRRSKSPSASDSTRRRDRRYRWSTRSCCACSSRPRPPTKRSSSRSPTPARPLWGRRWPGR